MRKQLGIPLLVALACVFVDAYWMGLPMTSWILAVAVIVNLAKISSGRTTDGNLARVRARRAVIYGAAVVMTIIAVKGNVWLAEKRGARIATAVKRYRAANGAYPERLEQLVPNYLPEIPNCYIRSSSPEFRYLRMPDKPHPTLFWVAVPPFGKGTYDFQDDRLRPLWD
jgi:hypothetical protein